MQIITLPEPFLHYVVHDFFDPNELDAVWNEIDYFHKTNSFIDNVSTGDPTSAPNKIGVSLDTHYGSIGREHSAILNSYQKIFTLKDYVADPYLAKFLLHTNYDQSFLNYYPHKSYYPAHIDFSVVSCITTLWKEPKQFKHGDLIFTDYDYKPDLHSNSTIIFPSFERHEVDKLEYENEQFGMSRYSISKFLLQERI